MFGYYFDPISLLLVAIAVIHFIRRRPEIYWIWIILMGGGLGAVIYIFVEILPDLVSLRGSGNFFRRKQRITQLEALVRYNPAAGNYEELADLYLEDGNFAKARSCYDKAISSRTDSPDPFYRRGVCEVEMEDYSAAIADLEPVVAKDPKYDFQRAQGLLAHSYANTGQPQRADELFADALKTSTLSETMYNYACLLKQINRPAEAREWAQRILQKKMGMPGYLKRRERPWFRRAARLLKSLPGGSD